MAIDIWPASKIPNNIRAKIYSNFHANRHEIGLAAEVNMLRKTNYLRLEIRLMGGCITMAAMSLRGTDLNMGLIIETVMVECSDSISIHYSIFCLMKIWHLLTGILYLNSYFLSFCKTILSGMYADWDPLPWWRHQMEMLSALLVICAGNSSVFPAQRSVTRSFDVLFDLRQIKRLGKQWWGRGFETPSRWLWRHCNVIWNEYCFVHNSIEGKSKHLLWPPN